MANRFLTDEEARRRALLEETGFDPATVEADTNASQVPEIKPPLPTDVEVQDPPAQGWLDDVQAPDLEIIKAQLAAKRAGGDAVSPAPPDLTDAGPAPAPEMGGQDVAEPPPDLVDPGMAAPTPAPARAPQRPADDRTAILQKIMSRLAGSKQSPEAAAVDKISQGLYHAGSRTDLPESFFQSNRQDDLTEALRWAQLMKATAPGKAGGELKPEYDPDSDYSKSRTEFMRYADPEAVAALEQAGVRPTGKTFDAAAINLDERRKSREGNEAHKAAQLNATTTYRNAALAQRAKSYQLQLDKFSDKLDKDELMAVRVGAEKTNKLVDGVMALKNLWAELPGGLENADKFLQDVTNNGIASRFLDDAGAARLRQAYDILASDKRHEWFGAALSKQEQAIANGLFGQGASAPPEQMAYAIDWLRKSLRGQVGAAQAELSQYPNGLELVGSMTGVRFDDPVFGAPQPPISSGEGLIPGAVKQTVKGIGRKVEQMGNMGGGPTRPAAPAPVQQPAPKQLDAKAQKLLDWANDPNSPGWTKEKADAVKQKLGVQ